MKVGGALIGAGLCFGIWALPAQSWSWLKSEEIEESPDPMLLADEGEIESLTGPEDGICLAAILAAEARYNIPDNMLLALGLQEAGFRGKHGLTIWPWSVNAAGEGRRFNSKADAMAFVRTKMAQGVTSIDIGCLQINLQWHPDAFISLAHGFDPARNIDYAARFLLSLYAESGDWWVAAGRYHSRNPGPQGIYLSQLRRNHSVALRNLPKFQALAANQSFDDAAFGADYDDDLAYAPAPSPPNFRTEGAIWGAEISGEEGGRRTLYSDLDITPILPNFLPPDA